MLEQRDAVDPTWQRLQSLSSKLPEHDRDTLVLLARQAATDAISVVLGIIDGCATVPELRERVSLHYGGQAAALNGNLQDFFLELAEKPTD
jgi:hypothetical protein